MQFAFQAMNRDGQAVADQLDAASRAEAVEALRARGLLVMKVEPARLAVRARRGLPRLRRGGPKGRDLLLFTRQMKMLLEAGAPLVCALAAVEEQCTRDSFCKVVARLRSAVERGDSFTSAMQAEPGLFTPIFCGMIAAGEATATLPAAFGRLADLAQQQQQTRKMIVGALIYPAVLCAMLVNVVGVLVGFVVPRFKMLFKNLHSPLPASTSFLFGLSDMLRTGWPYLVGALAGLITLAVIALRTRSVRRRLDEVLLRTPVIGRVMNRLLIARVLRMWAAMLRSHVPLLETIQQSRAAMTNGVFTRLLERVEEAVAGGGRVGRALAESGRVEPVIVSAILTGEENGKMIEAVDFVSSWMDEDNVDVLRNITRLAEPVLLALMGAVVGGVAMSLFIPLFDMATAAG